MRRAVLVPAAAAVGCFAAAVFCWLSAPSRVDIEPLAPGEPAQTGLQYDASLMALSVALATLGGLCVVAAFTRWYRGRS